MNATFNPSTAHAVYSMSSMFRWGAEDGCSASATAIAAMERVLGPQEDSEASEAGTAAHDEIDRVLGPLNMGMGFDQVKEIDPDHPAAFGIALFVDYARKLDAMFPGGQFFIEQRVRLTDDIWGRLDLGHWHAPSATVTIADDKNGFVGVDAERNHQLRGYAASLILQHKLPAKWIRYVVVQPNDFRPVPRVKQWIEPIVDLEAFATRVAAIPNGPLTFRFGAHCRDCPLLGGCEPTRDLLPQLGAVMARGPSGDVEPHLIPLFLALKKPIDHFFEGLLRSGTKKELAAPGSIPGMKLVTAVKHRTWKNEQAAREAIFAIKGLSALSPPTPAQAEAMGIPGVDEMADKPPGGPALALASDKRPDWKPRTSSEMFAGIPGLASS